MSLNTPATAALEYSSGFRNPSAGRPALSSWSLTSAITLANMGLDALVPKTWVDCPAATIATSRPCIATSGNPRPVVLNRPASELVAVSLPVMLSALM